MPFGTMDIGRRQATPAYCAAGSETAIARWKKGNWMAAKTLCAALSAGAGFSPNAWKVATLGTPGVSHAVQKQIDGTIGSCRWMTSNRFSRKNFRIFQGETKSPSWLLSPLEMMFMTP